MNHRLLTDEEVTRKFGIKPGDFGFEAAKSLSHHRPDTTLNDMPIYNCPHCGQEGVMEDYANAKAGGTWTCGTCDREMFIIDIEVTVCVKLSTEP